MALHQKPWLINGICRVIPPVYKEQNYLDRDLDHNPEDVSVYMGH